MATMRLETLPDTGTVTVACKLPNGLRLDLPVDMAMEETRDAVAKSARERGIEANVHAVPEIPFATLKGWSVPHGVAAFHVSGGYGLTTGVDAAKFKQWFLRMKKAKYGPVEQGLVFACAAENTTRDKAAEQASIRSGLERIDPDKPGRGVEPADKAA